MQITTKEQYLEAVVGKRLVNVENDSVWVMKHPDGSITGEAGSKAITGTWTWEGTFWCRTIKVGGKDRGSDCLKMVIDGDMISSTRNKGKGEKTPVYRISN